METFVQVGEVGDIAVHKDTPALFKEYYKRSRKNSYAISWRVIMYR